MKPSQSVLDSLADAECLRLIADVVTRRGIRKALDNARFCAWSCASEPEWSHPAGCSNTLDVLTRSATRCARAAFRAVPGLRA